MRGRREDRKVREGGRGQGRVIGSEGGRNFNEREAEREGGREGVGEELKMGEGRIKEVIRDRRSEE